MYLRTRGKAGGDLYPKVRTVHASVHKRFHSFSMQTTVLRCFLIRLFKSYAALYPFASLQCFHCVCGGEDEGCEHHNGGEVAD